VEIQPLGFALDTSDARQLKPRHISYLALHYSKQELCVEVQNEFPSGFGGIIDTPHPSILLTITLFTATASSTLTQ